MMSVAATYINISLVETMHNFIFNKFNKIMQLIVD